MTHTASHIVIHSSFVGPDGEPASIDIDFTAPAEMSHPDVGRYVTRLLNRIQRMGETDDE